MRILVFGGGGYIGIPLCESLCHAGHTVGCVDRFFFGKKPTGCLNYTGDTRWVDSSIFTMTDLKNGDSKSGWDAVVDLAGLSNDATCEMDPALTRDINWKGGERVARLAAEAGIPLYIYASSAAVYGQGKSPDLTEEAELLPLTQYAHSKVRVEDCIRQLEAKHPHFKATILRNATVFGVAPRMRFDLAINVMTMRALRDRLIYVMGGGEQWRPFIHVGHLVQVIRRFLENPAQGTFNVGSSVTQMTIGNLARNVQAFCGGQIHDIPDDKDLRSYHLSFEKLDSLNHGLSSPSIAYGIKSVMDAIKEAKVDPEDPTCYTLQFYKSLMEWDRRLVGLRLDGRLL